jgi:hypothetical protein
MRPCVFVAARRWGMRLTQEHLVITGGFKTTSVAAAAFPSIVVSKAGALGLLHYIYISFFNWVAFDEGAHCNSAALPAATITITCSFVKLNHTVQDPHIQRPHVSNDEAAH